MVRPKLVLSIDRNSALCSPVPSQGLALYSSILVHQFEPSLRSWYSGYQRTTFIPLSLNPHGWMEGIQTLHSPEMSVCLDWDLLVPYFMGISPRLKLPSASVGANGCPELVPSLDGKFQAWPSPVGPGHPTWVNLKIGHLNLELISGTCVSPGIAKWGSSSQHEAWWRALC